MNFFLFIVLGAVAGWLAGYIFKGGGFGFWVNLLVGIIGGVLGGWVFDFLGISGSGIIGNLITAVIGALILLWIISLFKGKKKKKR